MTSLLTCVWARVIFLGNVSKTPLKYLEIFEYLQAVLARPSMYAKTREAYLAQVTVLLEVLGHQQPDLYTKFLRRRGTAAALGLEKEITERWLAPVIKHVQSLLDQKESVP